MGRTVSLEARRPADLADALNERIAPGADCFVQPIGEIEDPERWRQAARIVGKRRGWKTRTGINARCAWVVNEQGPGPARTDSQFLHRLETMIAGALENQK